jgi:hypothetical protein
MFRPSGGSEPFEEPLPLLWYTGAGGQNGQRPAKQRI